MAVVYLNGDWLPSDQARIPISDRGFLFGDGVFETARVHRGKYFRLKQHLARLENSARIFRLETPPIDRLTDIAEELVTRNGFEAASLRITLTRGSGGKGLARSGAGPQTLIATLSPTVADWKERAARGWRIAVSSVRRPDVRSVPAELKGLGRAYALLAHFEAEDAGFDDALLLSAEGYIAEGPTWNVFWRKGGTVFTPSLETGILEGVTRSIMMQLAEQAGFAVEEGRYHADVLGDADEIFATMTSNGVVPFSRLDGRSLSDRTVASRLQSDYWSLVDAELGQTE